jgi:DNA primase
MSAIDTLFAIAPHLREDMKPGQNHVMVRCPFHAGGAEKTPSCSISTFKPVFWCFGCKESGHLSRLLRHFGLSKTAIDAILPRDESYQAEEHTLAARMLKGLDPFRGRYVLNEEILDAYRMRPRQLVRAGFDTDTLRHFEVGFDDANMRITFPLRSVFGDLLGISGRTVIGADQKYRIYDWELKSRPDFKVPAEYTMEESKSAVLWHGHVVRPFFFLRNSGKEDIVITEGFKACMWTWQAGIQDVVALVGSYLTDVHAELLARATRKITLFLDNNEAGIKGTHGAANRLLKKGIDVAVATYPDHREQPDDFSPQEVQQALREKEAYRHWAARHRLPEDLRRIKRRMAIG